MKVDVSAPGKLILIGEYGVLFGAPAVVMAVDRRARVRLDDSGASMWGVDSPGLGWEPARFTLDSDGSLRWHSRSENSDRYVLFERVLKSLLGSGLVQPEAAAPFAASLDTRAFFEPGDGGPIKLGLGSSAALTVALASALVQWAGSGDPVEPGLRWMQRLLQLHRAFQGGKGSGVDLAASLMGGFLEYRLDSQGSVATVAHLDLPEGLHFVVVWTGRAADTSEFLNRLNRRMDGLDDRSEIDRALDRLGQVARVGVLAFRDQHLPSFLEAIDSFGECMAALGQAAGLDVMSPEHVELRRLARLAGVSYKPSGAGGGDIGIGFADDRESLDRFVVAASETGFNVVEIAPDSTGLR